MKPVGDTYSGRFFKQRHKLLWRAPILFNAVVAALDIDTLPGEIWGKAKGIDFGCAIGEFVSYFSAHGINMIGIEGSRHANEFIKKIDWGDGTKPTYPIVVTADLRTDITHYIAHTRWNFAMSLEVAEHIEPEYADAYLRNLTYASSLVLITAAPPGQGGHGHVNCQPKEYWEEKMHRLGYGREIPREAIFSKTIRDATSRREMVASYADNIMIYKRREHEGV